MLDLIGKGDDLAVHVFHLFFDFLLQKVKSCFFLFALAYGLTNLLIILDITISQDGFELFFILGKFLLISVLLIRKMSQLLFFLFVLTSSADAGFQNGKQFVASLFLVFGGAYYNQRNTSTS